MSRRKHLFPAAAWIAMALVGCGTAPERAEPPETATEDVPQTLPDDTAEAAALELPELRLEPRPPAPLRGLTRDDLYSLLVADLAGRGGDVDTALQRYLETAREKRDPRVAERATQLALHVDDDAAALEASRRWVELAPESREAHSVLARLRLERGESERARSQLRRVIELSDGGTGAGLREAATLVGGSEHPEAALEAMAAIAEEHPDVPVVHYAMADLAARAGHPERALEALERTLGLDPEYTDALVLRARIRLEQGEPERAFEELGDAYRARPFDRALAIGYLRLLVEAGRTERAKREMQQVHERFGDDAAAVRSLALMAMQGEMWDHATLYLERLVAMDARTSMARYYLGRIAQQEGDCTAALRHFIKVGQGDHRFDAELRAAVCMAEVDRLDEARLHLERMQARYSAAEPLARIAMTHAEVEREAGDVDRALEVLGNAIERYPDNSDLRYTRALTAEQADRFELARRDLNEILEREPDNVRTLNALGYMLADRDTELGRARDLIERALEQDPEDPAILDSMGWVLFRQGEHREAADYLRRAYELDPGPEIAAHLGEVLWVLGQRDEARRIWEREKQSDNEVLRRTTQRLRP